MNHPQVELFRKMLEVCKDHRAGDVKGAALNVLINVLFLNSYSPENALEQLEQLYRFARGEIEKNFHLKATREEILKRQIK